MSAELRWFYQSSDAESGFSSNYRDGVLGYGDAVHGPTTRQCDAARKGAVIRRALLRMPAKQRNVLQCAYSSVRVRPELRSRYGELGGAVVEALLRSSPTTRANYRSSEIRKMVAELLSEAHEHYRSARGEVLGVREKRKRRIREKVRAFVREIDECLNYTAT
tara:strand:- start:41 stop:529 length:489 start_codon:yes stop_codon:yes gene_type:complete